MVKEEGKRRILGFGPNNKNKKGKTEDAWSGVVSLMEYVNLYWDPKIKVVSVVHSHSVIIDQSYLIMLAYYYYDNTCPHQCDGQYYFSIN